MSEPHDRVELGPPGDDEQSGLRRAPYAALAAAGIVVATVFATVAALAGERAEGARQPPAESNPIVVNTSSDTSVDAPTGPTETAPAAAQTTSTTENPARTTTRRRPTTTTTRSTQTSPTPTQPTETQPTETQPPSSEPTSTTTSTTTTTTTTSSTPGS